MDCRTEIDSKLAQENETYVFYCATKNMMANYRDCQKCKYNKYKRL